MRKIIFTTVILLMVASLCFAQPRNPTWVSEGETDYTDIGVGGITDGAPGYIKLTTGGEGLVGVSTLSNGSEFYLWIGSDGALRYASAIALSYTNWGLSPTGATTESRFLGATPSLTIWEDASGIVIGTQTAP